MATWKQLSALSIALLVGAVAMPVHAQTAPPDGGAGGGAAGGGGGGGGGNNPGGGGGGGGGGQNWRNMTPEQRQQAMADRMKQQLGMTDDEFTAIQPKLEAVMKLERDLNPRGGGMFGGGRNRRGNQDNPPAGDQPALSPLAQAREDLQTTIENKDSTADEIKAKLDAYRDAKTKAKDDLSKAQADLKSALSQRQEAQLVLNGMLD